MTTRFLAWLKRQIVSPDPWEPQIQEGQWLLRERNVGECIPSGKALALCDTPEEVIEYVARHGVTRFFVTTRRRGECETATEKSAAHLLGKARWEHKRTYRFSEPEMTPAEVQWLLEMETRAA